MFSKNTVKCILFNYTPLLLCLCLAYYNVFYGMIGSWFSDENNSHGFIVPLVSGYLVYKRRRQLSRVKSIPDAWGLLLIFFGVVLLIAGWLASEYFTMRFSFIVVLSGGIIYFYGMNFMSILWGPVLYLILMIPVPAVIYDAVAFPLKLFVTSTSVMIMKMMGVMVTREGNIMAFPNITLEVVNACSGLRSLTSLLAVGLAYVMLFVRNCRHRIVVFVAIFPIALVANMVRVVGTGVLSQYFGAAAAEGFFHEFAGLVVFMVSLFLIVLIHTFLTRISR